MSTSKQPPAPATITMAPATNTPMVQIKLPETFNGDRTAFKSFMQDCFVHILHHKAAFDHDDKKITGGTAKAWKENWLATKIAAGDLGTYEEFKMTLTKAFTPIDKGGYARAALKNLRQKKGKLAEYITNFKNLVGQSRIDSEPALAEYFMEGIQPEILKDVFRSKVVPTKMEDWYIETSCIELQQLRLKEIEDQRKGITSNYQGYYGHNSSSSGRKDPNAMDVDWLSTEEIDWHRKE